MPNLVVRTKRHPHPGPGESILEATLEGFIDAANTAGFEGHLEAAYRNQGRALILNFQDVHYINSSGISLLIRYFELYRERGGFLVLASVAREVGLSMHLLGVTSFIPFLKDVPRALKYVDDKLSSAAGSGRSNGARGSASERTLVPLRRRTIPELNGARVLAVLPTKGRFTRVLRLRFKSLKGEYYVLHDADEALEQYDGLSPDLVVVDHRCDVGGDFVRRIKTHKDRSLTSVVKLYSKDVDVAEEIDFKVWENDYLVEPFEVLELFSLAEAELRRLPKDRKVLHQQVHFEFKSTRENLERAYELVDVVLRRSALLDDDATALYAALKEGIDNAVIHGSRFDSEKTIDVNLLVDKKKITVIVEDEGEGFDYEYYLSRIDDEETFERAKRRILEDGQRGGLGILLMAKCADRIDYSGSGNILRLEKNR